MREKKIIEAAEKNIEGNLNVIFLLDLADYKGGIIKNFEVDLLFAHRFKLEQYIKYICKKGREVKDEIASNKPNMLIIEDIEAEIKELLKQLDIYNTVVERNRMTIVNDCILRLKEFQKREDVPHSVKRINIGNLRNIHGF